MDELQGWIVAGDRWHHFEIEISSQRLGLIWVEAVGKSERQDVDLRIAQPEVGDVRLDLDNVADELMFRIAVETVVFAKPGGQVETRAVHVPGGLEHEST